MEDQKFSRQVRQVLKKSHGEPTKFMEFITCIQDMNREGKAASYPGIVRKMWPEEWQQAEDKVKLEKTKWDLLCKRRREINARLFSSNLCFNFYIKLSPEKHFKILTTPEEIRLQRHKELEWNLARERSKSRREKILQEIIELNSKSGNLEKEDSEEEDIQGDGQRTGVSSATIKTEEKRISRKVWAALTLATVLIVIAAGLTLKTAYFRSDPQTPPSSPTQSTILKIPNKPSLERMAFEWPNKSSIAVLPFTNMSKEKEQEYIADGLTENIVTSLSQIPKIFVIARNSVFAYKGKPVTVQQVAEDLAVQYVLEGSVQQIEDRVRINVQLIDAINGHHLWAKRYDRKIKDIFDLQDEITLKIVISISGELGEKEEALARHRSTNNLEAWSYAIKSLPAVGPQRDINRKARESLLRAVGIDPNYAWAWSRLALIHYWDALFGFSASREESVKIGLELAQKAIALDENLPEGHVTLALLLARRNQYDQALEEAKKGVSLGPNNSDNLARAAQVMFFYGSFEECLALINKAIRLDPNHGTVHLRFLAGASRYTGQYEEAIVVFKRMIEIRKGTYGEFLPHIFLASLYGELNRIEEAKFHAKAALEIKPDTTVQWMRRSHPFKNPEDMERMVAGMRKAGFPEK
jgi:TolB-like protein/Tfp pilus assembly protein PilF